MCDVLPVVGAHLGVALDVPAADGVRIGVVVLGTESEEGAVCRITGLLIRIFSRVPGFHWWS
jgi:hypothetical protein